MVQGLWGLKGSLGSSKAEVVHENTLKTIPGSDLVSVPNVVVVGPVVFSKNVNIQTDRQTDKQMTNIFSIKAL